MKKRTIILSSICAIALCGSGMRIYLKHMLNNTVKQVVNELNTERNVIFSQPGFYDPVPISYREDQKFVSVDIILESDFKNLENLEECSGKHFNLSLEDAGKFIDAKADKWYPYEWIKSENDTYSLFEYENNRKIYQKTALWYSDRNSSQEIKVNVDAVSNRIHSISLYLPYADNMRTAFSETAEWMGLTAEDGEEIFDKMLDAINRLGDNKYVGYKQDGFDFYMWESDYEDFDNMRMDKRYYISISLVEE